MTHVRGLLRATCLLMGTTCLFAQASFKEEINLGVQAYKQAKYEEAIAHFRNAIDLEPQNVPSHLYLATAYAQQHIPGVDSPENIQLVENAISEYQQVLKIEPQSIDSLKGVAYLYLQTKKFDDAKDFYRKAIQADPSDPENYYSIGVIDWTQTRSSYEAARRTRFET